MNNIEFLCSPDTNKTKVLEVTRRCLTYNKNSNIKIIQNLGQKKKNFYEPVIFTKETVNYFDTENLRFHQNKYYVDYENYPFDGWSWHDLLYQQNVKEVNIFSKNSQKIFSNIIDKFKNNKKCYIFGTGPSLDNYKNLDLRNSIKIVCNTIVKNPETWHNINPNIIVAGDAIYHFGINKYSRKFFHDLIKRLKESPDTYFIYPNRYHQFIIEQYPDIPIHQLISIPTDQNKNTINGNLNIDFSLPNFGNALTYLLLPIATTLSKDISLLGFDGKSPTDKLFWNHSSKHNYINLIKYIKKDHPMFFEYQLPKNDPFFYIKNNLGDSLEKIFNNLEINGWNLTSLNPSYTATINKRYHRY